MANQRLVLCGGARLTTTARAWRNAPTVPLCLGEGRTDVHLRVEHVTRKLLAGLPDVAADLLELAAFVYVADQAVGRGGTREFEYGRKWRRHFRFEVPVRAFGVWSRPDVRE